MADCIDLPDDVNECTKLGIAGLHFTANVVESIEAGTRTRVLSNTGYIVGHLVTHAPTFTYGPTIGYHIGQVDQLTFLSFPCRQLCAEFIDCRANSPSLRRHVIVRFSTSATRKLVIPAGVAHTFHGIGEVLTRNDLLLFSSTESDIWRVEDDLTSIPIDLPLHKISLVTVNSLLLPRQVALFFYRLQSAQMRGGPSVAHSSEIEVENTVDKTARVSVKCRPNSYFAVAPDSWGILPSTESCEVHLEVLHLDSANRGWSLYPQHAVLYTCLEHGKDPLLLVTYDPQRKGTEGDETVHAIPSDERWHLFVPAGTAHRIQGHGDRLVRVEFE